MKVGDIIRVTYPTDTFYAGEHHVGVVTGTCESGSDVNTFWCFGTGSEHIVDIFLVGIEVISES